LIRCPGYGIVKAQLLMVATTGMSRWRDRRRLCCKCGVRSLIMLSADLATIWGELSAIEHIPIRVCCLKRTRLRELRLGERGGQGYDCHHRGRDDKVHARHDRSLSGNGTAPRSGQSLLLPERRATNVCAHVM